MRLQQERERSIVVVSWPHDTWGSWIGVGVEHSPTCDHWAEVACLGSAARVAALGCGGLGMCGRDPPKARHRRSGLGFVRCFIVPSPVVEGKPLVEVRSVPADCGP